MGIEPTSPHGLKEAFFPAGGTVGDVDLELVAVIQAWPDLPESVKDAIRALVLRSPGEAE
jgi:hypothetical protein